MGVSGYVSVENYYDWMNCYIEVNANPGCDSVEVTLTSLAIENWGREFNECRYDYAFLTDLDGYKYDELCGCKGDGCSDLVWGRNSTDLFDDYDYTYVNYNSYDSNGAGDYDADMYEYWEEVSTGSPKKDTWILPGNGFRLNIQSDATVSHGEIELEWTCVEDTTTATVTSTTSTTTTEYYDRYTTYSTGTTTLTTSSADSTWNPYMTTKGDTSCAMFHNGLDSFFSQVKIKCRLFLLYDQLTYQTTFFQIRGGINAAIDNELMTDFSNRNSQFKKWMTKVWTKFENNINGNWHGSGKLRDCIMESVTNSPGENLSTEILGSDCRLDLEYQGIPHMCRSLTRFMNFAYSKCETQGRGSIHWANYEWGTDTQGLLDRLEFRCKRMLEIIS